MSALPLKLIVGLGNPDAEHLRTRHNAGFWFVDELDFDPGTIRLKKGGGAGGHNGMRDMIAQLGDGFWRMRIGVGHPGHRDAVLHYVLGRPSAADLQLIQDNIADGCDVVPVMIADGPEKAMNRLHTKGGPP